ncbi:MAG: SMC-Scp complex subunit ScpB [Bacteroidota bacterium]|jgi:segregation and condensation protein B
MQDYEFIDGSRLSSVIEALIFASNEPISSAKIREIIVENEQNIEFDESTVDTFVQVLNERYESKGISFRIERVGGGYTFLTQKKYHYWLSIFQHENAYRKLSQSAIETLAIVAYRQPITKPEVDQIRGVDSGYILRQLMEKALIEVAGRGDGPGKPLLYKTSRHFLRHFGLNSVQDLPKPREIEEILKDDDMAEHRQLLMSRQLMLEAEEEDRVELKGDIFEDDSSTDHGSSEDEEQTSHPDSSSSQEEE